MVKCALPKCLNNAKPKVDFDENGCAISCPKCPIKKPCPKWFMKQCPLIKCAPGFITKVNKDDSGCTRPGCPRCVLVEEVQQDENRFACPKRTLSCPLIRCRKGHYPVQPKDVKGCAVGCPRCQRRIWETESDN
jgi:hypothetical protein